MERNRRQVGKEDMEAEEKAEWVSLSGQAAGFPLGNLPRMRTGTVSGGSAAGGRPVPGVPAAGA